MIRRSHFSSISDHTSPSSARSSAEPTDQMSFIFNLNKFIEISNTSIIALSRSSFFELLGLRQKRENFLLPSFDQQRKFSPILKMCTKKRKRRFSENDSDVIENLKEIHISLSGFIY